MKLRTKLFVKANALKIALIVTAGLIVTGCLPGMPQCPFGG